jgi:hypothetical protein
MPQFTLNPVANLPDYSVSPEGFIFRAMKHRPRYREKDSSRLTLLISGEWYSRLRPQADQKGYLRISFGADLNQTKSVHRLVLSTYKPCVGWEDLQVNHKDRNTSNPNLDNLEWCDQAFNCNHRSETIRRNSIQKDIEDYFLYFDSFVSDTYIPLPTGGQSSYDVTAIKALLEARAYTTQEVAAACRCTENTVLYYGKLMGIPPYRPPSLIDRSQPIIDSYYIKEKILPHYKEIMQQMDCSQAQASIALKTWKDRNSTLTRN